MTPEPLLDPYDYMASALADFLIDEVSLEALESLLEVSSCPEEFFYGMQSTIELQDIVKDHYMRSLPYYAEEEAIDPNVRGEDRGYGRWGDDNIQDEGSPDPV